MEYGICNYAFIPLRAEPSEKSEMVSQLLFGEHAEILKKSDKKSFILVKNLFDEYEGWCDIMMLSVVTEDEINKYTERKKYITRDIVSIFKAGDGVSKLYLSAGSTLYSSDNNTLEVFGITYRISPAVFQFSPRSKREQLIASAKKFLNVPYLWGGRSSFGTDCSGFTQNIYKQAGIPLPRDTKQQALCGKIIKSAEDTLPGDLMFFHNDAGEVIHTGIYAGNNRIIHASGRVRQDMVDHRGIFCGEKNKYSHNLLVIKRILDEV
jgi:gamma-D-glutamyl-L-lysine dipeptidyl-peptidase